MSDGVHGSWMGYERHALVSLKCLRLKRLVCSSTALCNQVNKHGTHALVNPHPHQVGGTWGTIEKLSKCDGMHSSTTSWRRFPVTGIRKRDFIHILWEWN